MLLKYMIWISKNVSISEEKGSNWIPDLLDRFGKGIVLIEVFT